MNIWEAIELLDNFIDLSDPDISLPNIKHIFQTAEAIRKDELPDWMQLVGLIHDLGKMIYIRGNNEDGTTMEEQWGIVGDTFIVGCSIPNTIVYPEFNSLNFDHTKYDRNQQRDSFTDIDQKTHIRDRIEHRQSSSSNNEVVLSDKFGLYYPNCGLDNCLASYGHDEYLYQVLINAKTTIPNEGLKMIRYHSMYVWHTYNEYEHFMNEEDYKTKDWVKLFNKYDLYSKSNKPYDKNEIDELKKYYTPIIKKYNCNELFL